MKLILAIVNNDDGPMVTAELNKHGIYTTKIASTGGFLAAGNMTFISGVEDEKVDEVIEIFITHSQTRGMTVPTMIMADTIPAASFVNHHQVIVGGATIFVLNVEDFRRV